MLPEGAKGIINAGNLDVAGEEGEDPMKCHTLCQEWGPQTDQKLQRILMGMGALMIFFMFR